MEVNGCKWVTYHPKWLCSTIPFCSVSPSQFWVVKPVQSPVFDCSILIFLVKNPYVSTVKLSLLRHFSPGCATRSAVFALLGHLPGTPSAGDDDGIHHGI
jgi:hypothetical protein